VAQQARDAEEKHQADREQDRLERSGSIDDLNLVIARRHCDGAETRRHAQERLLDAVDGGEQIGEPCHLDERKGRSRERDARAVCLARFRLGDDASGRRQR
jgi:hypothetical protein